jgi:hypothetical protein
LYEGLVNFMAEVIVAAEAEQLLIGVIRCRTVVVIRGGMDITLVDDSPSVHATPYHRIHSHTDLDPLGCGDSSSVSSGDAKRDIVLSVVTDEAVGSGG